MLVTVPSSVDFLFGAIWCFGNVQKAATQDGKRGMR